MPPPLPPSNASRSAQDRLVAEARADNLTVRELALRQDRADILVGSATEVADDIQKWFETRAVDGFTVISSYLPGALDSFVDLVVPELDRRGLLRPVWDGRDAAGPARPGAAGPPCSGPFSPEGCLIHNAWGAVAAGGRALSQEAPGPPLCAT
ncbi:hypothetical protein ACFXJ6_23665 [Streptomyces sp. NPDC059218]|uniref:hypothetical protein n=1 Tax=unclassified Streptomyces TaxID=2593676 RepID=UPI00369FC282